MAEMFTVRFENVGRGKMTWEEQLPRPVTTHAMVKAIKRKKVLLSQDIEFTETTDYSGHIFAGLHSVGSWFIVPK